MGELSKRVSEKDKEKGINTEYTEIINESMYIRPEFIQGYSRQDFDRRPRPRYRPDMRNHANDPYLYRHKTPNGIVSKAKKLT